MNAVTPVIREIERKTAAPRHARLFELIRQHNLAAMDDVTRRHRAAPPQQTVREFAESARRSLLPQEQQALGICASFGR